MQFIERVLMAVVLYSTAVAACTFVGLALVIAAPITLTVEFWKNTR